MKLIRYREKGNVKPGILDESGSARDASELVKDWNGQTITDSALSVIKISDLSSLPLVQGDIDYAPCVGEVGKFLCIGLNYSDHAKEVGMDPPAEPILFMNLHSFIRVGLIDTIDYSGPVPITCFIAILFITINS